MTTIFKITAPILTFIIYFLVIQYQWNVTEKDKADVEAFSIPEAIPSTGLPVPILSNFTGLKFIPPPFVLFRIDLFSHILLLSQNEPKHIGTGSYASFTLFPDYIRYEAAYRHQKNYSDIEKIDIFESPKKRREDLIIHFKDSNFTFEPNVYKKENLILLVTFFQKKGVRLSDKALKLIENI